MACELRGNGKDRETDQIRGIVCRCSDVRDPRQRALAGYINAVGGAMRELAADPRLISIDLEAVHRDVDSAITLPELIRPLACYGTVAVLDSREREIRIGMRGKIHIRTAG